MKLSETICKKTKPTGKTQKLADGELFYLEISPSDGKYWPMKYRFYGKEKCRLAKKGLEAGLGRSGKSHA